MKRKEHEKQLEKVVTAFHLLANAIKSTRGYSGIIETIQNIWHLTEIYYLELYALHFGTILSFCLWG